MWPLLWLSTTMLYSTSQGSNSFNTETDKSELEAVLLYLHCTTLELITIIMRRAYDLRCSLILHRSLAIKPPANSFLTALGLTTETNNLQQHKGCQRKTGFRIFWSFYPTVSYKAHVKLSWATFLLWFAKKQHSIHWKQKKTWINKLCYKWHIIILKVLITHSSF